MEMIAELTFQPNVTLNHTTFKLDIPIPSLWHYVKDCSTPDQVVNPTKILTIQYWTFPSNKMRLWNSNAPGATNSKILILE